MKNIALISILVLSILSIGFSEIIIGDEAVSYIANIYFNISTDERIVFVKQVVSIGLFGVVASLLFRFVDFEFSVKGILLMIAILVSISILINTFSIL
ncbi:MAG: hypothetical protein QW734_05465 [Candidatus Bathyarchaeia archaeon]